MQVHKGYLSESDLQGKRNFWLYSYDLRQVIQRVGEEVRVGEREIDLGD